MIWYRTDKIEDFYKRFTCCEKCLVSSMCLKIQMIDEDYPPSHALIDKRISVGPKNPCMRYAEIMGDLIKNAEPVPY